VRPRSISPKAALALSALLPLLLVGAAKETQREAESEALAWETLARTRTLHPSELLQLGVARARARRNDEASHAFRAVALGASDTGLAAIAYHDLGVLAVERGDFRAARDAFLDALALLPDDTKIRFNLEWTLRALAVQPPPARPEQPPRSERDGDPGDRGDPGGPGDRGEPGDLDDGRNGSQGREAQDHARPNESSGSEPDEGPDSRPDSAAASPGPPQTEAAPGDDSAARGAAAGRGEGEAGTSAERDIAPVPSLDRSQREMWLERAVDDPSRALRNAAAAGRVGRRNSETTW